MVSSGSQEGDGFLRGDGCLPIRTTRGVVRSAILDRSVFFRGFGSWASIVAWGVMTVAPGVAAAPVERLAPKPDRFDRIVLDAGHGGHDEGAKGPSGLQEKDLVLDVAKLLAGRLHQHGIAVVMTRTSDEFLSLEQRTAVANDSHADLFLSIHANASPSRKPKGIETYFASLDASDDEARATAERENSAFGAAAPDFGNADPLAAILGDLIESQHLQESSEFAKLAQASLSNVGRAPSRGVKQAPFVVLMGVQMPSSLVEIGFLTNPDDEKGLRRRGQREDLADALVEAVLAFAKRYDARRGRRSAR